MRNVWCVVEVQCSIAALLLFSRRQLKETGLDNRWYALVLFYMVFVCILIDPSRPKHSGCSERGRKGGTGTEAQGVYCIA